MSSEAEEEARRLLMDLIGSDDDAMIGTVAKAIDALCDQRAEEMRQRAADIASMSPLTNWERRNAILSLPLKKEEAGDG